MMGTYLPDADLLIYHMLLSGLLPAVFQWAQGNLYDFILFSIFYILNILLQY